MTPLFRLWWRINRSMTLGVRGVARDEAGRVMLVRHSYVDGWHFPGGGVERGETAEAAMRKEFAEEAALAPEGPLRLFGAYLNPDFPGDHILLFEAPRWRELAVRRSREITDREWFPLDNLPPDATTATRRRLAEMFAGANACDVW